MKNTETLQEKYKNYMGVKPQTYEITRHVHLTDPDCWMTLEEFFDVENNDKPESVGED